MNRLISGRHDLVAIVACLLRMLMTFGKAPLRSPSGSSHTVNDRPRRFVFRRQMLLSALLALGVAGALSVVPAGAGRANSNNTIAVSEATHYIVNTPMVSPQGNEFSFTVGALDLSNSVDTAYAGTVHFTSSDSQAILPMDSTLINGERTFLATFKTGGHQTITVTDTNMPSITGTSNNTEVAEATHYQVNHPIAATAGIAFSFTVEARDQSNNIATGYTGTVHFTSSDGQAILPANATLTNGEGNFLATLKTAGSQTITLTDTTNASITSTSNNIEVTGATHYTVNHPIAATAGSPFSLTVEARDQFNGIASGYTGTVHFTSSDGQAILPDDATLTNGQGNFLATLKTAGSQSITATDTSNASITSTSNGVFVVSCADSSVVTNADDGPGSLRQAILDACPGAIITFDMTQVTSPITLTSGQLLIDKALTIQGPGANLLTLQRGTAGGTPNFRIFDVTLAAPQVVTVSGLTISNGNAGGGDGGGIRYNGTGTVNVINSTLSQNSAGAGGGINSIGNLNVINSTLVRNQTTGASAGGGAIISNDGMVTIINCTISDNRASRDGGGLLNRGNSTATLVNVTITKNRSDADGISGSSGGGIRQLSNHPITLRNTIVAGNFGGLSPGTTPDDIRGNVDTSSANNLIGTGGSGGLTNGAPNNNQVDVVDARLGSLANNGGPTQTHALLSGSLALDAGDDSVTGLPFSLTTDQRGAGFTRQADGPDADISQTLDIGAFEADPSIEDISDKSTNEDVALPLFLFKVGDLATDFATPLSSITVTSSNPTLVPNGNIVISPGTISSRALTITPAPNQNGTATITVTVTKAVGGTVVGMSDTFILTVNAGNESPSFTKGPNQSGSEDSGARTVANWATSISPGPADEAGQTVSFLVQGNTNPALFSSAPAISSTGTLTYAPAANANGTATINFALMDNGGGTDTSPSQTFVITVTEVNDAPTAGNDTLANLAEGSGTQTVSAAILLANDSPGPANENGQNLSVKTVGNPVGGTVSIVAGNVIFTPTADYFGPASFQYTVADDGTTNGTAEPLTSLAATVTFNITELNDAPDAANDTLASVAEDSGMRTIAIASLLSNDNQGPANDSGQTLTLTGVSDPVGGTVSRDGTNVYFTPAADFNGPAGFQYTVTDNGTSNGIADPKSDTATVSFGMTEVNDPPIAVNDTLTNVAENSGPRTILFSSLLANDAKGPTSESGQTLVVKTATNPVGGTVSLLNGNVLFTPTADYFGPASFQYTVEDNGTTHGVADPLTSGIATASFNITEVNDGPVPANDTLGNIAEDSAPRAIPFADLLGNDAKGAANESGQTLTVITATNSVGGTVVLVPGFVVFTPADNYNGPASFDYTVEDNGTTNGVADPKTGGKAVVQFNITEVNDFPMAVPDMLPNVAEDSGERSIAFANLTSNDLNGPADESGQTLIVRTISNPVGVTVSIVEGTVRVTPLPDFNGAASFQYTVRDDGTTSGFGDEKTSAAATVSFSLSAQADAPSVTNATTNANTQTASGLVISRNPADGPEVTHFKITGVTGGRLFKNDGTTPINNGDFITFAEGNTGLKFTPGPSINANGSFTVQASLSALDPGLSSLSGGMATAVITVNPLDGVIRFSESHYSVAEGAGSMTITVERTGDTSHEATVDYASSDHSNPADSQPCTSPGAGFASSRCDFTMAIATLRFAAGETSKTFNVMISQDNYTEGTETLDLTLSNPTGGAVFGIPSTAILSITDDAMEPATNSVDASIEFVRSQYHDFLNREPDAPGLAFWGDNIEKCNDADRRPPGQTVSQCIDNQRESTAVAFFMSPEFQITGGFVYHLYKGSLTGAPNYDGGSPGSSSGRFPTSLEFMRDVSTVSEGIVVNNQISGAEVEANRNRLAAEFVQRSEFVAKYGGLNHTLYVDELFNTTGITPTAAEKQALVDGLTAGTETKASVLRKVVDGTVVISESNVQFTTTYGQAFINQENRRMFVFMEYIGYLRRNPDAAGFVFWLGKLNFYGGDPFQAEMVRSFILSPEYRLRFGQP